jgi:ABC-type branched-subunit amino acid transport system ATPase component
LGRDIGAADALALGIACDAVILNTGHIVYDGPAEDARNQPELFHVHLGVY